MRSIEQIRAKAAEHFNGTDGFDNSTRKNAYECEKCGSYIVTVDREPGVTPFMVSCGNCSSMATSKFYRVQAYLEPTHEWYRPETLAGLKGGVREHVENGGLLLRKIGGGDSKQGWQKPDSTMAKAEADMEALRASFEMAKFEASMADRMKGYRANIIKPKPVESKIKREDYPSRQAYRHALAKQGKG
ncbi:hypothetical protein, partial [Blastomonas sp. CCH1-A6]|uniref:hypothetical protein n=1 Tax=Blastomonas sp. CCH1-A6 TaxID=1768762 RepID=UPI0008328FBA